MNRVTVGEVKRYLGLDGEEQNTLLAAFLTAAEHTVEKVLRQPLTKKTPDLSAAQAGICRTAILFTVWQLYFHRDNEHFRAQDLEKTLGIMLSDIRRTCF